MHAPALVLACFMGNVRHQRFCYLAQRWRHSIEWEYTGGSSEYPEVRQKSLQFDYLHYNFYCALIAVLLILVGCPPELMRPTLDVLRRVIIFDNLPKRQSRRHLRQLVEVCLWQSLVGVVVDLRIS